VRFASFIGLLAGKLKAALRPAWPTLAALAGVGVCTWVSFHLGQSFAFTGFLFLVLVVLVALYCGFWQATAVSIAAAASLDYFFVPPIFSFTNSPANWVALGAFEFTALVISRLSLRARTQAFNAITRHRDIERLYETSRRILLLNGSRDFGNRLAALIRDTFELDGVELFDALSAVTFHSGSIPATAETKTREAYFLDSDVFDASSRSWYCVLRLGVRPIGSLALHGADLGKLAATALASLSGIALERFRAIEREAYAQAARRTEELRTAVLDALAHDFKTPLAIARTASSGLLAIGGLSELQIDLVTSIDRQAAQLDHLTSRLLAAARLESTEFKPHPEAVMLSGLLDLAFRRLDGEIDRSRFRIFGQGFEVPIYADPELMVTSLVQLVTNAVKYSDPGSPIDVTFAKSDGRTVFRILSRGVVVKASERERIFERFYRSPDAGHAPAGTGLGLSIVKKIVEAHHGSVWAEGEKDYGTAFSISLPAAAA
jgi:two-component system, OmpR family, sensor histidine kinase KdpD